MSWIDTFTWVAETIGADLFRAWPDVPLPGCPCPLCRGLREEAARQSAAPDPPILPDPPQQRPCAAPMRPDTRPPGTYYVPVNPVTHVDWSVGDGPPPTIPVDYVHVPLGWNYSATCDCVVCRAARGDSDTPAVYISYGTPPPETEEQRTGRVERERRAREEMERAAAAYRAHRCAEVVSREAAEARARDLLLSCLDAAQARQFQRAGFFEVTARPSGHRYRIEAGWQTNIVCVYGPEVGRRYCIVAHSRESWVPLHDQLLMQKLVIEADEPRFLATAY